MRALSRFSIPIRDRKNGKYEYRFEVDDTFFENFENNLVSKGNFDIILELEKKSDHLELDFFIEGFMKTTCDRCTADINLPMDIDQKLLVKYDNNQESKDDEVWLITYETVDINLANIINEFICLAVPITKTYDCDLEIQKPCNEEIKEKIGFGIDENDFDDDTNSPFSDLFKNIDL